MEELFCIANGRLEAKAICHQHSWWVLKGSCTFATPFLFTKKEHPCMGVLFCEE